MPSLPNFGNLNLSSDGKKAYMVLLQFGKSSIEKVAFLGDIPQENVSGALSELLEKNLVLKDERDNFSLNPKKVPQQLSGMPKFNAPSNVVPSFLNIKGYTEVDRYWKLVQKQSENELLIFSGDLSWIDRRYDDIRVMTKKGVKCKIIFFKFTKKILQNVKKAVNAGAEVSYYDDPTNLLRCIVSDEDTVFVTEKIPKAGSFESLDEGVAWKRENTNAVGTIISGGIIPRSFRHYFYSLWRNSLPFNNYFQNHTV